MDNQQTPETDGAEIIFSPLEGDAWVPASISRKLERERDEAREAWYQMQSSFERSRDEVERVIRERDEARHKLELCMAANSDVARIAKERDEARKHLKEIEEYGTEEINAAVDLRQKLAFALVERDEVQKAVNGLCEHIGVSPANTTLLAVEVLRIQRERDEAREALSDWENAALHVEADHPDEKHCACVPVLRKLLTDAREKYDTLATEHMLVVNKLCKERDDARGEFNKASVEANALATSIQKAEYSDAKEFELLGSVAGVISQIDNMYAGVRQQRDEAREDLEFRRGLYKFQEEHLENARKELQEWKMLCLWGGTPEHIHDFIKGQQTRIHEAQGIERTCEQMERERDEAREENKKFREALEWIAERYDDFKPLHSVAMDAYEMSCIAKSALRKEES